jgi:NADPH:quinone reductase-like Zn-dependent oxidoreductase
VAGYSVGDRVFGVVTKPFLGDGSFGEYVTVQARIGLAKLPDTLTFNEAAALGLAGTAAWDAVQAGALGADSAVLISGATGGVGSHAVQLAAAAGALVIATARTDEDKTFVAALGAQETVDCRDTATAVLARHPEGIDVVIHLAGDAVALLPALHAGGRLVSTLIESADQLPQGTTLVVPVFASPATETLERLAANQSAGATAVSIQRTYRLEEAPAALAEFTAGKRGKLVITL